MRDRLVVWRPPRHLIDQAHFLAGSLAARTVRSTFLLPQAFFFISVSCFAVRGFCAGHEGGLLSKFSSKRRDGLLPVLLVEQLGSSCSTRRTGRRRAPGACPRRIRPTCPNAPKPDQYSHNFDALLGSAARGRKSVKNDSGPAVCQKIRDSSGGEFRESHGVAV